LRLWLIDGGIEPANAEKLDAWLTDLGVPYQRLAGQSELTQHLQGRGSLSSATFWRLCLSELLPPDVERVLYIDVDTLVLQDLCQLNAIDFGDDLVAAVRDPGYDLKYAQHKIDLGLPADAACFNAGVLFIHLAAWRQENIGLRVRDFIATHRKQAFFLDQDGLNVVCHQRWQMLEPRWNMMHRFYFKPMQQHITLDQVSWRQMADQPAIIHFSARYKPNHLLGLLHPKASWYWQYRSRTPWPDRQIAGQNFGNYVRYAQRKFKTFFP
jgi:lipopolysaccharide biosynthesis glycosyltransferase